MQKTVTHILDQWDSRKDVHTDVSRFYPDIDMVAVHRWFSRKSIPGKYWAALVHGAKTRGISVSADDLALAHADWGTIPAPRTNSTHNLTS